MKFYVCIILLTLALIALKHVGPLDVDWFWIMLPMGLSAALALGSVSVMWLITLWKDDDQEGEPVLQRREQKHD